MANTPNMNLALPVPSVTAGPLYGVMNNAALSLIDSHNHTQGQGLQVPTAGLNINADLGLNNFNLTTLRSSRFTSQSAALSGSLDLGCVYVAGGDLWYNNSGGAQIQITSGSTINVGSVGGISGLGGTAGAATFNSTLGTFIWTQNANRAANLDCGNILLRNPTGTNNPAIVIAAPNGVTAYTLTLPAAVPSSNSLLQISNTGVLSAQPWNVDASGNLNATGAGQSYGANVQRAGQLQVGTTGNAQLNLFTNNLSRWAVLSTGELAAQGGNRAIQNVLNPVNAQDAATKNYVDTASYVPKAFASLGMDVRAGDSQVTLVNNSTDQKFTFAATQAVSGGNITSDTVGRITINVTGQYLVSAAMACVQGSAGQVQLFIFRNGAFARSVGRCSTTASIAGEMILSLNATDFIEMYYNSNALDTVNEAQMNVIRLG